MAEEYGKLVSCERCGKTVFLKRIGEGEADGGFTRWDMFETFPEGWKYCSGVGTLCPTCSAEWQLLIDGFMKKNDFNTGAGDNG